MFPARPPEVGAGQQRREFIIELYHVDVVADRMAADARVGFAVSARRGRKVGGGRKAGNINVAAVVQRHPGPDIDTVSINEGRRMKH